MKSSLLVAIVALALRCAMAAPWSADYQAAIREATERYRGDGTGIISIIVYEEVFFSEPSGLSDSPPVCIALHNPFPYEPFVLGRLHRLNGIGPSSVSLQRFTPNHPMQLTATRFTFTLFDD
jgi:hypothetical protein